MRNLMRFGLGGLLCLAGCAETTSYVHSDAALGKVVVYRNGVAYFERTAHVEEDTLKIAVPGDKIDDFLKSLTVIDARTGQPTPVSYPTARTYGDQLTQMELKLPGTGPHEVKLTYVTEAPSWKSTYRIVLGNNGKVNLQAWAIIDNTSGEDWQNVKLGVGSSSALSFRFDLQSVRMVYRDTLQSDNMFAMAPPTGGATYGNEQGPRVLGELSDSTLVQASNANKQYQSQPGYGVDGLATGARAAPPAPQPVVSGSGATMTESVVTAGSAGGSAQAVSRRPTAPGRARALEADVKQEESYKKAPAAAGQAYPRQAPMPQAYPQPAPPPPPDVGAQQVESLANQLRNSNRTVVIEGYAGDGDADKMNASLGRANQLRDELIRRGIASDRVLAVGNGQKPGRGAGVRIVEAENKPATTPGGSAAASKEPSAEAMQPIGTSHFESTRALTVPRGGSAMVSVLKTDTDGEVVYYYDPDSARGNTQYPFKAVRLRNPTESVLESGPVTVFGEGRFIGEGLSEPIPAKSMAFIPFALDRQVMVERVFTDRDEISRILAVQRGVFSTEIQHIRSTKLVLRNRMVDPASVYLRYLVPDGYKLTKSPKSDERLGGAPLFRVDVPGNGSVEVVLESATPVFRSTDIRTAQGMEMVRVFLSSSAMENPTLKSKFEDLVKVQKEIGNLEQQITTTRDTMAEYRKRVDELHTQILTLRAVKSAGTLTKSLEAKMQETDDRLAKATLDVVNLQEKLMVARIKFQDGVAELSHDTTPAAPAEKPKAM